MTRTKLDALLIPQKPLHTALKNYKALFDYFVKLVGQPEQGSKIKRNASSCQYNGVREPSTKYCPDISKQYTDVIGSDNPDVYNFLLLAYLDSAGYVERSKSKSPLEQFRKILERCIFVVEKIQRILQGAESALSKADAFIGDARSLPVSDQSVDGILFSQNA